jgi:hypothetical protein
VTGLALGIQELEIEFLKPGIGEIARARYSRMNLAGDVELPRVLGGMYCQVRLCPATIDQPSSQEHHRAYSLCRPGKRRGCNHYDNSYGKTRFPGRLVGFFPYYETLSSPKNGIVAQ